MKNVLLFTLSVLFLLLMGCGETGSATAGPVSSAVSSSGEVSSTDSGAVSSDDSIDTVVLNGMGVGQDIYQLVPKRSIVKNEEYYKALAEQADGLPTDNLQSDLYNLAVELDLLLPWLYFDQMDAAVGEEFGNSLIYFTLSWVQTDEYYYPPGDTGLYFVKEEVLDKYLYGYFNFPFNYSDCIGYSTEQSGAWLLGMGFEYPPDAKLIDFVKNNDGIYEVTVQFTVQDRETYKEDVHDPKKPYTKKYTFRVENQRVIIQSIQKVE